MLIAGNWKMNGGAASVDEFRRMIERAGEVAAGVDLLICPPAVFLAQFAGHAKGSAIALGGQDCHAEASGAHTGDIAAEMLAACGATAVIVGHSERRADHGETDASVAAKAAAAQRAGLTAIICVGETEAQRDASEAATVVERQLAGSILATLDASRVTVAYEPVWAIGTGRTPTTAEVAAMHGTIRAFLDTQFPGAVVRILYGGSVKPSNAAELLAVRNVDGALVGGASLKADDFLGIALAAAGR